MVVIHQVISHQGSLSGWSFIREVSLRRSLSWLVFHQGGLIRLVSQQCSLSPGWSLRVVIHQVISHQCGLIRVVSHLAGLSSEWSLIGVVSHLGGLSGWSFFR